MTLTPVKASALHTSKQISCASSVAAAEVNPGVWFAPFGSVGMAAKQDKKRNKKSSQCNEGGHTESGMDRRQRCGGLSIRSAHDSK
jgi:hypothetical protein